MPDHKYLAILQKGTAIWNQWRTNNSAIKLDFRGVKLVAANLSGMNLSGIDFSNSKLTHANLTGAILRETNFRKADLSGASLSYADMKQADLNHAALIETDFSKANLSYTNFSEAKLRGANFSSANLNHTDLHKTNLSRANFSEASFKNANLSGADLTWAELVAANLIETNLSDTNLSGVSFKRTYLKGVIFSRANLSEAICDQTTFSMTKLSDVSGLDTIHHHGASSLDTDTLFMSGNLPEIFLYGCGIPKSYNPHYHSCCITFDPSDQTFAQLLHDTFYKRGILCWPNTNSEKFIFEFVVDATKRIRYWDKTIICCSKKFLTGRKWDMFEAEQHLMGSKDGDIQNIIPLNVDGYVLGEYSSEYESQIMSRMVANFQGYEQDSHIFDHQIEQVITALRIEKDGKSLL